MEGNLSLPINFRLVKGTKLYRSSMTEYADATCIESLHEKFQIRSFVDLRSPKELAIVKWKDKRHDNPDQHVAEERLVDKHYPRYVIAKDEQGKIQATPFKISEDTKKDEETLKYGSHFLIDLMTNVVKTNIKSRPLWLRILVILAMIVDRICGTKTFTYRVLFFFVKQNDLIDSYTAIVSMCDYHMAAALDLLTDPSNVPAVIMCAHGKDRTGILAALIQGCCGVDDHTIATDYAKSEEELQDVMHEIKEAMSKYNLNDTFSGAKYEVMIELLDFIRKQYGGIPEYLESIGFKHSQQEALKKNVMAES